MPMRKNTNRYQLAITQTKKQNLKDIEDVCKRMFDRVWIGVEKFMIPIDCPELILSVLRRTGCCE